MCNAVDVLIKYDIVVGEKIIKRLLQTLRLPFSGQNTSKRISTEKGCFRNNKDSGMVVN